MKIKLLVISLFFFGTITAAHAMEKKPDLDPEIYALVFRNLQPRQLKEIARVSRQWCETSRQELCRKVLEPRVLQLKNDDETWRSFFHITILTPRKFQRDRQLNGGELEDITKHTAMIQEILMRAIEHEILIVARELNIDSPIKLISFLHTFLVIMFNNEADLYLRSIHEEAYLQHHFRRARELLSASLRGVLLEEEQAALNKIMDDMGKFFWRLRLDSIASEMNIYQGNVILAKNSDDDGQKWKRLNRVRAHMPKFMGRFWSDATTTSDDETKRARLTLAHLLVLGHVLPDLGLHFQSAYASTLKQMNTGWKRSSGDIRSQLFSIAWHLQHAKNPYLQIIGRLLDGFNEHD